MVSQNKSPTHIINTHTCIRTVIPAWPKRIKNFRLHFVCLLEFQNKLVPRTNFAFCLFFTKKIPEIVSDNRALLRKCRRSTWCQVWGARQSKVSGRICKQFHFLSSPQDNPCIQQSCNWSSLHISPVNERKEPNYFTVIISLIIIML